MNRNPIALALVALLAAAPASAASENFITQSSFDEGIVGWEEIDQYTRWEQIDDAQPGNPNPGSLEMSAGPMGANRVKVCLGMPPLESYKFHHYVKIIVEGTAVAKAGLSVLWHTDELCKVPLEGPFVHPFSWTYVTGSWQKMEINGGSSMTVRSATISLGIIKESGGPDDEVFARFDDVFVGFLYDDTSTTTTTETTTTTDTTPTTTVDVPNAPGCGDPSVPYDTYTTTDALFVLRSSVGTIPCDECLCDTDDSGTLTTSDALRVLRLAVGFKVSKYCGSCVYEPL